MSKSNKHDYKNFTKSPLACLLHCIENILDHSSGKCPDSLTMAALSFTKLWYIFNLNPVWGSHRNHPLSF